MQHAVCWLLHTFGLKERHACKHERQNGGQGFAPLDLKI